MCDSIQRLQHAEHYKTIELPNYITIKARPQVQCNLL